VREQVDGVVVNSGNVIVVETPSSVIVCASSVDGVVVSGGSQGSSNAKLKVSVAPSIIPPAGSRA